VTAPDLPGFLLARIAEDEADARKAAEVNPPPWRVHLSQMGGDTGLVMGGETDANRYLDGALWDNEGADSLSMEPAAATHIARHDPARVLAECAAQRAVVEFHRPVKFTDVKLNIRDADVCIRCHVVLDRPDDWPEDPVDEADEWQFPWVQEAWPCGTLSALALPYAAHPDYRPEWRPRAWRV
jgi:hypothetical protein